MTTYCTDGNLFHRTGCILSYSGSSVDIAINYIVLVINLVWCVIALSLHTKDIERSTALRNFAISALAFVFLFQIGLCLLVHCAGISIMWCAMGGWVISERKRLKETSDQELSRWRATSINMETLVVLLDVGVIMYYAIEAEVITTVAHICAVILGATLSLLSIRLLDDVENSNAIESVCAPSTSLLDKRDT